MAKVSSKPAWAADEMTLDDAAKSVAKSIADGWMFLVSPFHATSAHGPNDESQVNGVAGGLEA
ncbi:uncharacterized protein GLRG_03170 [Colletotrichum graminicola M1.001]|uniref:Uncharacterized protein n=1 Tax=Colletotrichum graminicola (strain M1.001 / M2 / FGSC 10212) TaxID=645133 RepID=E3QAY8_COLGM|nr:uncharacterized protein GLRG_03170 [Colletotrichum graminicola M1.001]EFQ28026.1 hypothetical protein GLRG_03170 [Colletotrichum graminicola M1.001]